MTVIGPLRQVRLVLGLGVRRWVNRITGGVAAKRKAGEAGATGARPPTARRRAGIGALLLLAAVGMLAQVLFSMWQFSERAVAAAEERPLVSEPAWQAALGEAREGKPGWQRHVRESLAADWHLREMADADRDRNLDQAVQRLEMLAAGGEQAEDRQRIDERVAGLAAALFAILALCSISLSLGMGNTDLARPEWDELWLASQPVSDRALFTARLLQYAFLNPLVWLLVPAAVAVFAVHQGMRWPAAAAIGLAAGAAWSLTTAAIRLLAETWLRQRLAHPQIKNLQAVCTVLGMASMVALYAAAIGMGPLPGWFLVWSGMLPWQDLPSGWAATAALLPSHAAVLVPLGLVLASAVAVVAVRLCASWSCGGLLVHDGTMAGRRGGGGRASSWRSLRVLGKDLILLRRDRALLVQALIMPLFMIVLQLSLNPQLGNAAFSGFHAAATFVVALGGWVLMSATAALAFEGQALWILAGAPLPLADAIRGKVVMWAAFATGYAILALAVIAICLPWPGASAIADVVMIIAGMPLLAALAVGIGAAATDPQATVANRRVGVGAVYLYMLVMGLFSLTVNRGGAHQRLAMLAILAVVAWALWQRLRDRLAYLFEPVDRPPRQVDLADGAWAAFAFLVLQGLIAALLVACGCELALAITLAFGIAGAVTAMIALLALWRARVPDLLRAVGIVPPAGASLLRTAATGGIAGLVAAAAGAAYLMALPGLARHLPVLQELIDAARPALGGDGGDGGDGGEAGWTMVVLAVVLAPLCEEFIFRGLLFRGLRNDLPLGWAAVASAGLFAVIHPSLGVLPVFGLGLACALAYARTGWLLAPVLAHATYNGAIVLMSGG